MGLTQLDHKISNPQTKLGSSTIFMSRTWLFSLAHS